jgi:hypothetical protein
LPLREGTVRIYPVLTNTGGTMGGILGIVVLVLDIIAILDVMKSSKPTGQKILWGVLILILPVIGLIAYYVVGKK